MRCAASQAWTKWGDTVGSEPEARKERDELAKKMTRAQIDEAVRLAREWRPR
jgi:hypothetical protein